MKRFHSDHEPRQLEVGGSAYNGTTADILKGYRSAGRLITFREHGAGRSGAWNANPGPGRSTYVEVNGCEARYLSFSRAEVRRAMSGDLCGCSARVTALEASVEELREQLAATRVAGIVRTTARLRELLLDVGELIEESLTSA